MDVALGEEFTIGVENYSAVGYVSLPVAPPDGVEEIAQRLGNTTFEETGKTYITFICTKPGVYCLYFRHKRLEGDEFGVQKHVWVNCVTKSGS